ncbi:MAG: glucoamylase [Akkermansiaceae bacterium]|nr:glucoamylase [Akkermansiaceae bacterium]
MSSPQPNLAPGAPGMEPRWTSSAKDGIGTAYNSAARIWFTLSHGIVNEVYYPHVDTPNTRDLQFLITDGETFCHEERRDLDHHIEYPEEHALLYRLTNTDRAGRYRIVKEVIGEPHTPVLLIHTRVEILDDSLKGKLKLYALLAPHLKGSGLGNSAEFLNLGEHRYFHAWQKDVHAVFGCSPDFTRRSTGYVGRSDGWQDLMHGYRMDWEYDRAEEGNIAVTGEIDLSRDGEFVMALSFGSSRQSAATQLLQALATPFSAQRDRYVAQWQRTRAENGCEKQNEHIFSQLRLSQCILMAHEDKTFPGATVASLSIPWGEIKDDNERGGYHLVWTRDMIHTATALLACKRSEFALRGLIWLTCVQDDDGLMPQNSLIDGTPYWKGIQLDEIALPVVLAWRLRREKALEEFDPWTLISRAATYLVLNGPVTGQERWEENSGYSPSTLAAIIASLVAAADFATDRQESEMADFLLIYADWLSSHLEDWTVTTKGELLEGKPRHYVRITPAEPLHCHEAVNPDTDEITLANGGGTHPVRNVVGGDFLQLVRYGIRAADDPVIVDSVAVIDAALKYDLPQGPGWRRYNHDGYGQKEDGKAFDGTGVGRCWPILTGERGHYELSAGRDPHPYLDTYEKFANDGGMIAEQLWDVDDLPDGSMKRGNPTGSAMPLCWSHAEYISLVRSASDGVCFDRMEPVYQRYVVNKPASKHDIWTFHHPIRLQAAGKILRLVLPAEARVVWSADAWATSQETATIQMDHLAVWYVDLDVEKAPAGSTVEFTFLWKEAGNWEGQNYSVQLV